MLRGLGSAARCTGRRKRKDLIEQGMETRRPSFIYIRAGKSGDAVTNVRVGGHVVQVIDGEVTM